MRKIKVGNRIHDGIISNFSIYKSDDSLLGKLG